MFLPGKGVISRRIASCVQAAASRKQIRSSRRSLVLPCDTRVFEGTRKFQKTLGCLEISRQPAQDIDHRWQRAADSRANITCCDTSNVARNGGKENISVGRCHLSKV